MLLSHCKTKKSKEDTRKKSWKVHRNTDFKDPNDVKCLLPLDLRQSSMLRTRKHSTDKEFYFAVQGTNCWQRHHFNIY